MEYIVIPLLVLVVLALVIRKMTLQVFHVYLDFKILGLMVVFAWVVSFILPGMFFQSIGFMGSVGISLISAAFFAWLTTVYEAKRQAPHVDETEREPANKTLLILGSEASLSNLPFKGSGSSIGKLTCPLGNPMKMDMPQPLSSTVVIPEQDDIAPSELVTSEERSIDETPSIGEHLVVEEEESVRDFLDETIILVEPESLSSLQIQPTVSDSLEDLLDGAFENIARGNLPVALGRFRSIREKFSDSEALPMLVAEIVSILQSQGNYDEAIAEISLAMQSPVIRRDKSALNVFEQKMAFLNALSDLLNEKGNRALPFEQIPPEWSDLVDQRLSATKRVQL